MLVSCVLVTLPVEERLSYLRRSVADYCRQTHAEKELVVVADRGDVTVKDAIRAHVGSLERKDVRLIDLDEKLPLGALRNVGWTSARGEAVAQWDDDDYHHPQRIEEQLATLVASRARAVYLEEVMQLFPRTRELYCINFRAAETKAHPGTLLALRSAMLPYPETGANAARAEDTFLNLRLQETGEVRVLSGMPHLYVYVSHGKNAWPDEHHRMLASRLAVSRARLLRRESALREGLRPFDFGSSPLTVKGYNGDAFTLVTTST